MGMSCSASISFGVDVAAEDVPWNCEEEDMHDWIAEKHGITNKHLWDKYYAWEASTGNNRRDVRAFEELHPEWKAAQDEFYKQKREFLSALPLDTVSHGYPDDERRLIICLAGTEKSVYLGDVLELEEDDFWTPDPARLGIAHAFAAAQGIPFGSPHWLLSVWYSY